MRELTLNPVGLLYGSVAQEAINAGSAGRLAGGKIGFQSLVVLSGHAGGLSRQLRSYQDLRCSTEKSVGEALRLLEQDRHLPFTHDLSGPLVMGVVNVTPDSFSDGGDFLDADAAIAQGRRLGAAGADILDIGGESTRPGAEPVSQDDELARILPVVEGLANDAVPVSVDTRKPEVMRKAALSGARLVNDISALTYSENSVAVAHELELPVILMHARGDPRTMQDKPSYEHVVLDVFNWLAQRLEVAENAGIRPQNLLVDPGIGFGKNLKHNLALLANLAFFHGLGVPVVLGASRKRFIGAVADAPDARQRLPGSIAAALHGAASGVQVIRVHDVAETRQAFNVARAIQAI